MPSLDRETQRKLEEDFTMEEVKFALMSLAGEKTPGLDGFPMIVYQRCWDFMHVEILDMVRELQDKCFVSCKLNTTFLALLPKVDHPLNILDYRSISLLYGVYKVLAKTLAIWLDSVLVSLISQYQGVVVKGRYILEEFLIANKLVDLRIRVKEPGIVCKIDFRKAFDCIN